jgi:uncharacterized membrane protein (Fun14 family)
MDQEKQPPPKPGMPRWKKVLIWGAVVILLVGAGLKVAGMAARKPDPSRPAAADHGTGGMAQPFVAGREPSAAPERREDTAGASGQRTLPEEISPYFLQGGLGFFIGLAIGTALRAVYKATLLILGVVILGVLGLSYFGVIPPIDWAAVEDWLSVHLKEADEKTAAFRQYLVASLPSAGLGGVGLVTGFKRK